MGDTVDFDEAKLKRLRNLKLFRDKSDDEIIEYMKNRTDKPERPQDEAAEARYQRKFTKLLKAFQDEYGVDMNSSNDAEALINLVRHSIQLEKANEQINAMHTAEGHLDVRELKNLGDYQRSLVTSISEFQDKLGITRKARKEKQMDDVPMFIEGLKKKAQDFWKRQTVPIMCSNCEIELARYWINFPDLAHTAKFELECWKCGEKIVYVG